MDVNNGHDANAKPPPLTSDQLNYLIWRYLQESGYGEAAVKLQRDWKVDAESLPFAPRIKGQALISLVQKGLRYYHLHQTLDEENGRTGRPLTPELFFFGPDTERAISPAPPREVSRPTMTYPVPSPDMSAYNGTRKHLRESGPNGSTDPTSTQAAPKKSRKSALVAGSNSLPERNVNAQPSSLLVATDSDTNNNDAGGSGMDVDEIGGFAVQGTNGQIHQPRGAAAGVDLEEPSAGTNGVQTDTRMDVDPLSTDAAAAAREPQDQEQIIEPLPLISTLANGENIGVQVGPAKIAQLAPATTILPVADGLHTMSSTTWHPSDSTLLTMSGQQFCGLWKISGGQSLFKNLVDPTPDTLVTAVAWEPTGSALAIATYSDQSGRLHLFDGRNLSLLTTLPASQRAIISLKWLPSGSKIVGIASSDDEPLQDQPSLSSLLLWDLSGESTYLAPSPINLQETILDLDCVMHNGSEVICVAGDEVIYQCRATPAFEIESKWDAPRSISPTSWTFIKCATGASNNRVTVIAASAESMHLWMPVQDILLRAVHNAPITGLQMRPRLPRYPDTQSFQEFATSSMDGTIKVWRFTENPNLLSPLFKVTLGNMSPVMALSYSLDGFCLAGAGYDKLRIWNADQGYYQPLAIWDSSNTDWRGASLKEEDTMSNGGMSSTNGDHTSLDIHHCLGWDASSKKVAFALASQLAIIDFQR